MAPKLSKPAHGRLTQFSNFLKAQKARRQARRDAMTRAQKRAAVGSYGIAAIILATGYALSASITGLIIATIVHKSISKWAHNVRWTGWSVGHIAASAFAPLVIISALVGHMATQRTADDSRDLALYFSEEPAHFSQDVAAFVRDFQAGTLKVAHVEGISPDARTQYDAFPQALMRMAFSAGVAGRADAADMNAAMPVIDLLFGERTILLYSESALSESAQRHKAVLHEALGKPPETATQDELLAVAKTVKPSRGVILATCVLDHNNTVLSATTSPAGMWSDVRGNPAAAPLIEMCQAFGPGRTPPAYAPFGAGTDDLPPA